MQPLFNDRFITLDGALLGLLIGPAERAQQLPNVIRVVPHAEFTPDEVTNATARPLSVGMLLSHRAVLK